MVLGLLHAASAEAFCVTDYQVKLRAEPSYNAKVTWVVGRYMPFLEESRKGKWMQVTDVDGERHWIPSSELSKRTKCVVVRVGLTLLRTGPGENFPLADIRTADRYTAFKRIEEKSTDDWYHVQDEGGSTYFVKASQVWRPRAISRIGF